MRVKFEPMYDMILKEAKQDGCIWIPYEVTEEENRVKRELEKQGVKTEQVHTGETPGTRQNDFTPAKTPINSIGK